MKVSQIQVEAGGTVPCVKFGNTLYRITLTGQVEDGEDADAARLELIQQATRSVTDLVRPALTEQMNELVSDFGLFDGVPPVSELVNFFTFRIDTFRWLLNFDHDAAVALVETQVMPILANRWSDILVKRMKRQPQAVWETEDAPQDGEPEDQSADEVIPFVEGQPEAEPEHQETQDEVPPTNEEFAECPSCHLMMLDKAFKTCLNCGFSPDDEVPPVSSEDEESAETPSND